MEFILKDKPGTPVSTLSEFHKFVGGDTVFTLHLKDGVVRVELDNDGNFIARCANINQEMIGN